MKIIGLVLAAGAGRRFGGPKALVELEGELLVDRAVRLLRDGGCDEVVVVLGASADAVTARARLDAKVVFAEDWQAGQGASLRAGLAAATLTEGDSSIVALVDQPWIGPEAVRRLRQAALDGVEAAVATYGGEPRNPVLLARSVWKEVAAAAVGDVGARAWLRANPERVIAIDCDGTGDPRDVDTPDDLRD